MEILKGHTSFDTAYQVEDYPYGFRLRTSIRYWIETTRNGERFVSCTLNPKIGRWNKPKVSTYSDIMFMYKDDQTGYIEHYSFNIAYGDEEKLNKLLSHYPESEMSEYQLKTVKVARAVFKTREHISVELKPVEYRHKVTGEITTSIPIFEMGNYERVTPEETKEDKKKQQEGINKIFSYYMSKQ